MVSTSISSSSNMASTKDSNSNLSTKSDSNGLDFNKIMKQSISLNKDSKSFGIASKHTTSSETASSISASAKADKDIKNDKVEKNDKEVKKDNDVKSDKDVNNDGDVKNTNDVEDNKDLNKGNDVTEVNKADATKTETVDDSKIDGLMKGIKDEIEKTFGISDDQLQAALANLGITMQDLLKPINLTNLVCEITGTPNALTLLTDSGLSEQLKSVMDFVNTQSSSLAKDLNISLDDLKAYIENSTKANQDQVVSSNENKTQVHEDVSVIKVLSEDVSKNVNNQDTTKATNSEQPKSDLQSIVEAKVTVATQQQSNGSMSKDNGEASGKNQEFSTITNNLTQSIQSAFDNIVVEDSSKINTADVIKQIVEAAKVTVTQEISSMEIQLNPENLGKINLSVVAKDGVITAQIVAENETVKKAIENQLNVLKENLNNQGIKIEAVEVTIASHSFENNRNSGKEDSNQENGSKQSSKPFRLDSIEDLVDSDLSDEERRVMNMLKDNNSSVEYSA